MKKKVIKKGKKTDFDLELLKHWKNVSTKFKLDWLESAAMRGGI